MKSRLSAALVAVRLAVALLGATAAASADPYVVTIEHVGANVVVTGSGEIDLTGLAATISGGGAQASINPSNGWTPSGNLLNLGSGLPNLAGYVGTILDEPGSNFGLGGNTFADAASGPLVD